MSNNNQNMQEPRKAVAYARFSTEMQRAESIDAQLRAIKKYANENRIILIGEYIDLAKSGKNDDRPKFQEMIHDSKKGSFDTIIVHKLDRFARNRYDSVRYRHKLSANGVQILSVLENYDSDSPEGVLMESLYEGMNEYYIRNLSREIMKGLKENAYQAKFTGGVPPLGYSIDSELNYIINEQEAVIVRIIFEMIDSGEGYGDVIKKLNRLGYTTKTGRSFGKNSIYSILKNPKYCGIYEFNATPKRDVNGRRNSHARKNDGEIIRVEDSIPSIITKDTFNSVQKLMRSRKRRNGAGNAKETYLLSGKIYCGNCGKAYTGHRKFNNEKRKYVVYSCGANQRKKECQARYIRRDHIEPYVLNQLSKHVFDDSIIPKLCLAYKEYLYEMNYESVMFMESQNKRLKTIEKEIKNIVSIVASTASRALIEKLSELEQEKVTLEFEIENYKTKSSLETVSEEELKHWFDIARELFKTGELETSKKLISLFIDKVIIYDEYVELKLKLKPDMIIPEPEGSNNPENHKRDTKSCPSDGAESGNRTHTVSLPQDFESCTSASSIISAH